LRFQSGYAYLHSRYKNGNQEKKLADLGYKSFDKENTASTFTHSLFIMLVLSR
jgi:hypothetical protein